MFLPWLGVYLITIMQLEQRMKLYTQNDRINPHDQIPR